MLYSWSFVYNLWMRVSLHVNYIKYVPDTKFVNFFENMRDKIKIFCLIWIN